MQNCVFCAIVNKQIPAWIVKESQHCLAFLDTHPVAEYHTLVIPKEHYENIFDIPQEVLNEIMNLTREVCRLYAEKVGIDSVQLFNNSGHNSAQSVFHFHLHILPRSKDDQIRFEVHHNPCGPQDFAAMLERLK